MRSIFRAVGGRQTNSLPSVKPRRLQEKFRGKEVSRQIKVLSKTKLRYCSFSEGCLTQICERSLSSCRLCQAHIPDTLLFHYILIISHFSISNIMSVWYCSAVHLWVETPTRFITGCGPVGRLPPPAPGSILFLSRRTITLFSSDCAVLVNSDKKTNKKNLRNDCFWSSPSRVFFTLYFEDVRITVYRASGLQCVFSAPLLAEGKV